MSYSSGMFYVYLECDHRQYLVAFPSRSHADKFWRIVQRLGSPGECRRFNSQFFSVPVLPNRIQSDGWDRRSCLVRLIEEGQNIPIVPPDCRPDNINGGMFYIRSVTRPDFYWYFEENTTSIGVSRVRQSRFMIQRAVTLPGQVNPEEDILVGEDNVNLSVVLYVGQQQSHRVKIVIDQWNKLVATNNSHHGPFKFWLFENGFLGPYNEEEGPVHAAIGPSSGERWEFVA